MTSRFAHRVFAALACVALVTLAPAWSEEPTKPKSPERTGAEKSEKSEKKEEAKVYTNADLRRPAAPPATDGESADSAATPPSPAEQATEPATKAPAETDPLAWIKDRQAQQAERERLTQEVELRLAEARTEVAAVEKRIAAIRNPFLAPPKPPEDDEEWAGQDNVERLASSENELEEARRKLSEAEAELRELRSGS